MKIRCIPERNDGEEWLEVDGTPIEGTPFAIVRVHYDGTTDPVEFSATHISTGVSLGFHWKDVHAAVHAVTRWWNEMIPQSQAVWDLSDDYKTIERSRSAKADVKRLLDIKNGDV